MDNETSYTAGTTTGRTLEVSCPFGSQTMANTILTQISGYEYQPYAASDAFLDPAAELDDAIYADGAYSILAKIETTFDALCTSDIAAPDGGEISSEYPYLPAIVRRVNSASAQAASAQAAAAQAAQDASDAQNDADAANAIITGWQYAGSTVQINGANIQAGTVKASKLQGGSVDLLNASGNAAGTMGITGASSADFKISINSNGALAFKANDGSVALNTVSGAVELLETGFFVIGGSGIRPTGNGTLPCGASGYRWSDVWSVNSACNTSDRNLKTDIDYEGADRYNDFFDSLRPVSYKFIDGHRTHIGMISQDVEQNLLEHGMTGEDFGGFLKDEIADGEYLYGLRYGEFISLCIAQIQALKARVTELEAQLNG